MPRAVDGASSGDGRDAVSSRCGDRPPAPAGAPVCCRREEAGQDLDPAGRRARADLLRRARGRSTGGSPTPATCRRRHLQPDPLRPAARRVGGRRRAPPGPDLPAPGRRVPAVPVHRRTGRPRSRRPTTTWSCSRTASRRFGLRAPARCPTRDGRSRRRPGVGRCEVVCFTADHDASFARLPPSGSAPWSRPGPTGPRTLPRCDGRGAGVLLREPRRGDRRHAAPPARPDLRLPVRDPADPRHAGRRPAPTATPPAATCFAECSPPSADGDAGGGRATSTGRPSCRPPPAGRSRSTCSRTARCPTCPRWTDAERDGVRAALPGRAAAASTRCSASPMPYMLGLAPGAGAARPRPGLRCTCSCSASGGPRPS